MHTRHGSGWSGLQSTTLQTPSGPFGSLHWSPARTHLGEGAAPFMSPQPSTQSMSTTHVGRQGFITRIHTTLEAS
jgi:hypothetical protein